MSYSRLSINPQFFAGIHTPHGIIMNRYHVDIQMITLTDSVLDNNIAVERIKYIIDEEYCSSILINEKEKTAKALLEEAGLRCIAFPSNPIDQMVGMSIFHKLTNVVGPVVQILDVNIHSDIGSVVYLHNEEESSPLDETEGWWHSNDPSCLSTGANNKVVTLRLPTWKKLGLEWEEDDEEDYEDDDEFEAAFEGEIIGVTQSDSSVENVVEFKPNDKK